MKIEPYRLNRVSLQEAQEVLPIFTQRFSNQRTVSSPGGFLLPALEVGQELTAVVTEELPDGRIVLNLAGTAVESDNPGGLGAGQVLRLRVELLEPQVVLHILTTTDASASREAAELLRRHLPEVFGQQLSLAALQAELAAATQLAASETPWAAKLKSFVAGLLQTDQPWSAERLMQFVQDSGLHYEAKLFRLLGKNSSELDELAGSDLKALLLGALEELAAAVPGGDAHGTVAGHLAQLESRQAGNVLAQLEGRAFQLQVPFFTGSGFTEVAISVQRDGGRKQPGPSDRAGYHVLFLLELEGFGRLKIHAHLNGENLGVIFYADRDDSIALLRAELPGLQKTLEALGYREALLIARPLAAMPQEHRHKFEALAFGIPPDVHLINVKA